jgi:four helix bundle protein
MQDYKKLKVWQKAHQLTLQIYQATANFSTDKWDGIASQLRGASAAIPINIAAGCARDGNIELESFLQISLNSTRETEYWLLMAKDRQFITLTQHEELTLQVEEIRKMILALIQKIRNSQPTTDKPLVLKGESSDVR